MVERTELTAVRKQYDFIRLYVHTQLVTGRAGVSHDDMNALQFFSLKSATTADKRLQRNAARNTARNTRCLPRVLYFKENKYNIRLIEQIRTTKPIALLSSAFSARDSTKDFLFLPLKQRAVVNRRESAACSARATRERLPLLLLEP